MFKWLRILLGAMRSAVHPRRELVLENLALRQQLAAFKHCYPRPHLYDSDRLFWVLLSRIWRNWRTALHMVQPATVVRWHRQGFKYYWRWKSRGRGRPKIDPEIRHLIRYMCQANPLWGAPRVHGELLKLGFDMSEATVSKYMLRCYGPPSQTWRAFLRNHGERHLKRILAGYTDYYNGTHTHLSLAKDSPQGRPIQMKELRRIFSLPRVGGLHHEYCRIAA